MSSTVFVAWWGAILSTIVLLWDIYKYRHAGPKLRFTVRTGMIMMPSEDRRTFVFVEASNHGERGTTITNLGLEHFENRLSWVSFRKRASNCAVVPSPSSAQPLPFVLESGAIWRGMVEQTAQLEQWATNGTLYTVLYHSHSVKPIRRRVTIRHEPAPKQKTPRNTD